MIELSEAVESIPLSPTLWANELVWAKRASGETVYHMGFGESPFPVPERLQKALGAAAGRKEYIQSAGLPELLKAVREYYRPFLGDYVDACDVIVAPGSKLILYALQVAIKGDLLMPVPSWVSYEPQAKLIGTAVVKVPTTLDDAGYHLSPEDLKNAIHKAREEGKNPTKIILNYPNNPTGLTIPEEELPGIAKVCQDEGVLIISDEIYGRVSFDRDYSSIAPHAPENTAVTTGLSKHLSLGGWRLGVGFIPKGVEGLQGALCRFISETWSCVPAPVQVAAIEAYKGYEDIEKHIDDCSLERRADIRDVLVGQRFKLLRRLAHRSLEAREREIRLAFRGQWPWIIETRGISLFCLSLNLRPAWIPERQKLRRLVECLAQRIIYRRGKTRVVGKTGHLDKLRVPA